MSRQKIEDLHAPACRLDTVTAGDLIHRVVTALDQNIRQQLAIEALGGVLTKRYDPIDTGQRGQHTHARGQVVDRTRVALQAPHRGVVVHRHHQPVAQGAGLFQIIDVTGMEDVETPIGHHDALTAGARRVHLRQQFVLTTNAATARLRATTHRPRQLGRADRRRAQLGHHNPCGHIGQGHRLVHRHAGRNGGAQRGHHGVARAGHIKHLLRPRRQVQRGVTACQQGHAFFATGHQDRVHVQRIAQGDAALLNLSLGRAMPDHRLELGQVGCNQGRATIALEVRALGVHDHRLAGGARRLHQIGRATQHTLGIIGQDHRIDIRQARSKIGLQRLSIPVGKVIFKIQTNQLLMARQDAQLGNRPAARHALQLAGHTALA